ncbi:hypothetical protein TREMEDRAFT_64316 [Tremella mesenterica DSM 1558]|uniref:uncharacterized protein n=1 Tax=Tremella mesenterica (strain ATCC 24925 / CBS 8224 / DSM 1558 / NBRC 9311 / NRRL Y-6157 / RJB 2259-6 / UBC 559-6) TaxID=578456 RepID=UPI0003F4A59F|nr:uncharacterized protein TREMEDRAFT_64316 [Tremella mesenterica DSM 1558]EIW67722.1 hypothetical protein TREMEDRAFT_64316 [Tremella mesenterica DSM 1558]
MTRPWHRSPVSANVNPGRSGQIQPGPYHIGSPSPERRESYAEGDVRIPALEAANRRLQEELRMSHDENDRLKEELAHWARWEAERRERTGTAGSADEFGRLNLHILLSNEHIRILTPSLPIV